MTLDFAKKIVDKKYPNFSWELVFDLPETKGCEAGYAFADGKNLALVDDDGTFLYKLVKRDDN